MLFNKKISRNLGPETDENLLKAIVDSIKECGGIYTTENSYQVGGQDILIMEFKMNRSKILLEIETYVGVTIKGKKKLVDGILENFNPKIE